MPSLTPTQAAPADVHRVGPKAFDDARQLWRRWTGPVPADRMMVQAPAGGWRPLALDLTVLTVIVTIGLAITFRLWDAPLRVPFGYGGDGLGYGRDTKTIIETGWVQVNERLGAPFVQKNYDFPIGGDTGHFVLIRLLSIFSGDWALVLNVFFLLGFYTSAVAGYLAQRWLMIGRKTAIVLSLLFAFSPYHFARGAGHIMLSSYPAVPIAVLLACRAASGIVLTESSDVRRWRRVAVAIWWLALCAVVASTGSYYALFGMFTIAMAAIFATTAHRTLRPLVAGAGYCIAIGVVFVINQSGTILYQMREGPNPIVGARVPTHYDIFGLRLVQLVTPNPGNFLGLDSITDTLLQGSNGETSQFLGMVATLAFFAMIFVTFVTLTGRRPALPTAAGLLAALTFLWLLISVTGGLSWLTAIVDFTRIRAWNRISIVIMFLVLTWAGLVIAPAVARWLSRRGARPVVGALVALGLLTFGMLDQTTGAQKPDMRPYAASYMADRAFFSGLEAELPTSSMVLQLPYRPFPEEPPLYSSGDYDLFRPYLHTNDLRFSYGGMKGREADWQLQLQTLPAATVVRDAVAIGFEAILIDRYGYADSATQLQSDMEAATGRSFVVSPDGRWSYVIVSGLTDRYGTADDLAAIRADVLFGPRIALDGCSGWEGYGVDRFSWCSASGTINIADPEPNNKERRLVADVVAPAGAGSLTIEVGETTEVIPVSPQPTHIEIELPDGDGLELRFDTDVVPVIAPGDGRDLRFRLVNPLVY